MLNNQTQQTHSPIYFTIEQFSTENKTNLDGPGRRNHDRKWYSWILQETSSLSLVFGVLSECVCLLLAHYLLHISLTWPLYIYIGIIQPDISFLRIFIK